MIQLTFVYILYSLYVVCIYKKHTKTVSVSQLYLQVLYSLYIICMYKKHTFQVSSCFQSELCTSFVQFVHCLYICSSLMYIFCTFIIIENFDLYSLCTQNIPVCEVVFCIIFLWQVGTFCIQSFCTNILVSDCICSKCSFCLMELEWTLLQVFPRIRTNIYTYF